MKKKMRKMYEQANSVSAAFAIAMAVAMPIALTGCAADNPETNSTETPVVLDLTGNWKEVEPEEKQWYEADIDDESITVYSVNSKNESVVWYGTYVAPEGDDKWNWTSEMLKDDTSEETDSKKTETTTSSPKATSEADKTEKMDFSYADGTLTFDVKLDDETRTVEMEKIILFDYSTAKEFEIKDSDGKVTGKYSVLTVNKKDVTDEAIEDWYNSYVADGDYEYAVIVFADEEGKGIYADSKNIYVNTDLSENKNNGYSKPDSKATYTVEDGKIDVTEVNAEDDSAEKTEKAEDKEESNDDKKKEENSNNTASSDSGKNTTSSSNTSKPSGNSNKGSSTSTNTKPSGGNTTTNKPSSNTGTSSGGNQSTTKPADPNAGKTKVWVVDTPAWDETVVVTPAWTEEKVVVDTPAWDETVVVQEGYSLTTCNQCGAQFQGTNGSDVQQCIYHSATVHGGPGTYHTDTVPPVTQVVHHEAVTHVEYIHHEAVTQVIHHDEVGHWEWR